MPIFAIPPTHRQMRAIQEGSLVHLSRQAYFRDIVSVCTGRPGAASAKCNVHIKATVGLYKNLSVFDLGRLGDDIGSYVYWFLGEPSRLQRFINVDNYALLPSWKPPADELLIHAKGSDVIKQCSGRLFYRIGDRCVASFGDYRGPAMVGPIPTGVPLT